MPRVRDRDTPSFKDATINMNTKEKLSYIWEYYKIHIIGTLSGLLLVFSIVHAFVTQTDDFFTLTIVTGFEHTFTAIMEPDANDQSGEHSPFQSGEMIPGIWFDPELTNNLEDILLANKENHNYEVLVNLLPINFESLQVLTTHFAVGVIDTFVTYQLDFQLMAEFDYFFPLDELPFYIPQHVRHGEYGIYLKYLPFISESIIGMDDLVIGVSLTSQNLENVQTFFETFLTN